MSPSQNCEVLVAIWNNAKARATEAWTKEAVDRYLQELASSQNYSYFARGHDKKCNGKKAHDEASLRNMLMNVWARRRCKTEDDKRSNRTWRDIVTIGDELLDQAYVKQKKKESARDTADSVDEADSLADPETQDQATPSNDSSTLGSSSEETQTQVSTMCMGQTQRLKLKVGAPPTTGTASSAAKKGAANVEFSPDGDFLPNESPKLSAKKRKHQHESPLDDQVTAKRWQPDPDKANEAERDQEKQAARKAPPSTLSDSQLERGAPRPKAETVQSASPSAPALRGQDLEDIGINDAEVCEHMTIITHLINTAAAVLLAAFGRSDTESTGPMSSPCRDLRELYRRIFGSPNWAPVATRLQRGGKLRLRAFLESLISAFLLVEVFRKPPLWSSLQSFYGMLQEGSVAQDDLAPALARRGVDLSNTVRALIKQKLCDGDFRVATVRPTATELARKLIATLHAHIEQLGEHGAAPKDWSSTLQRNLAKACEEALILKAHLTASPDAYSVTWFYPGQEFDDFTMEDQDALSGERVGFTSLVGVHCTPAEKKYPATVPVKAQVIRE